MMMAMDALAIVSLLSPTGSAILLLILTNAFYAETESKNISKYAMTGITLEEMDAAQHALLKLILIVMQP